MAVLENLSVIIPARNSGKTLSACLESINSGTCTPSEIIVVNDGSTDDTRERADSFGCRVIDINCGLGPMQPRLEGARQARFPVLLFIDADVCVRKDTLQKIAARFEDPFLSAVTGLLARSSRVPGFFTQYKNEYMNYIFGRRPPVSDFLYGSIWAVRKEDLIYFEPVNKPFGNLVSDSEMGLRLSAAGRRILLDKTLEVEHLKKYGILSLIKNDFQVPFMFARIFVRYRKSSRWGERRSFSHASLAQTAAAASAASALAAGTAWILRPDFLSGCAFAVFSGFFLIHWSPFFRKVSERSLNFALWSVLVAWLDAAVMFFGMVSGFIYALIDFQRPEKAHKISQPVLTEGRVR